MIFLLRFAAGNSYDGTCIGVLWAQSAVNPTISLKYTVTLSNCSGRTISPAISCWATGLKIYITLSYIALLLSTLSRFGRRKWRPSAACLRYWLLTGSRELNPICSMWDLQRAWNWGGPFSIYISFRCQTTSQQYVKSSVICRLSFVVIISNIIIITNNKTDSSKTAVPKDVIPRMAYHFHCLNPIINFLHVISTTRTHFFYRYGINRLVCKGKVTAI
jgi:hypothetical protein